MSHYDFWWNLPRDYMVTSEWGLPPQYENGIVPEDLLADKYGHRIHFWDLRARRHVQTIDLGANHQMALAGRRPPAPGPPSRRAISEPITRWRSRCGPHTIRSASTGSWASWSTPQTSKARSGPGGARAASFTSKRRRQPPRNPRPSTSPPPCCWGLPRSRLW